MPKKPPKPKTVFLVAFVEGGNLTSIVTNDRKNLLRNVTSLRPHHREEEYKTGRGAPMNEDEINDVIDMLEGRPGRKYRFEDRHGDADISVINITGKKFTAGKEIW